MRTDTRSKTAAATLCTGVLLTGALLAGCGSNAADTSGAASPSGTPSSPATPTASAPTPTATATPTATLATPKPTARPTARDGSNLRACRDATCQVLVRGRTTIRFSGGKLVITKIDKFAYFTLSGRYGGGNGRLAPACAVTFGYGGLSTRCGGTRPAPRASDPPGLTLRVPYVGQGAAVIDMSSR